MNLVPTRIDLIKLLPNGTIGAEIGVQKGYFSVQILNEATVGKLFLVDAWKRQGPSYLDDETVGDQADNLRQTEHHIAGHIPGGRVEIIRAMSVDAATNWKGPPLDWVYIDADHSYGACYSDLVAWARVIKRDGSIFGHDYAEGGHGIKYGVIEAVRDFCEKYGWELTALTDEPVPSFAIRRRG